MPLASAALHVLWGPRALRGLRASNIDASAECMQELLN
jgi:hypothetical protein